MVPGGFIAWSREQLLAFLATHAVGTMTHLAMKLLIGTACRRSDVVLLGLEHIVNQDGLSPFDLHPGKIRLRRRES